MDSLDIQLSFRHEAGRAKWRKEIFRPEPPPFLGPLVTIQETMVALNRCRTYVQDRMDDGRLYCWKDPTSKRVWILKDDVDILKGDIRALEERGETRGGKRGPRKPNNPQSAIRNPQSEDLDAIGGWEHPKPPPVIVGESLEKAAQESQARYEQKQRENEEWYAAELAKLEDRDPEEAVRQLQIERGWLILESAAAGPPEPEPSLKSLIPTVCSPRKQRTCPPRPVSWSNPLRLPPAPVEPYVDSDDVVASFPDEPLHAPFPTGWINKHEAAKVLQCSSSRADLLAIRNKLQRVWHPKRRMFLFDSVEIEQLAEQRPESQMKVTIPGKRFDWWGPRAKPMELQEFDYWITTAEAAQILGITAYQVTHMCDRGLLPCKQTRPGVRGSRIHVPHCAVFRLSQREDYLVRKKLWADSRRTSSTKAGGNEEWNLEPIDPSRPSKATDRNHGDYVTARQAALLLGVSIAAVKNLRERGRLPGIHLHPKRKGTAKNPWWFFRRADVDNLLADPEYRKRAARGKKRQYRTD
jgi:hypothetical protein